MRAVFGPFCFDLDTLELTKFGVRLGLEEKPARALACLIERRGTVVSRGELRNFLWDQAVNIDFNHGLNKAINKLRTILGDEATQPKYLETLSRRGYRFIGEIELILDPANSNAGTSAYSSSEVSNGIGHSVSHDNSTVVVADVPGEATSGRADIDALLTSVSDSHRRRNATVLALSVALLLTAAVGAGFLKTRRSDELHPVRAVITLPPNLRLMTASENLGLAISPDGTKVVFSAVGADGIPRLWLRQLDSLTPEPISGTERGSFPFWSPDEKDVGFFTDVELKRVNLVDHSVATLCAVDSPRGGSWSRDGVILLASDTRGPIYRVSANGGMPVPVTTLDEAHFTTHRWPVFLQDGKHFVFLAANHAAASWTPGSIYLASIDDGEARLLGEADSNVVPAAGSLLFLSHGKLMSQPLNLEKGRLESHAAIIADGVQYDSGLWHGTFAATSSTVVYRARPENPETETISWFDRKGNKLADVGRPGVYRAVSLSPDGKTIAVLCGDPDVNVCFVHGDRSVTQITQQGIHGGLAWLSDSSAVSYYSHQGQSSSSILMKPLDGVTPERVLMTTAGNIVITSWHPDNGHALVMKGVANDTFECLVLDRATGKLIPYLSAEIGSIEWPRFSPDGHWVAYENRAKGTTKIYIASYPVPSVQYSVPIPQGMAPKWRGDGRELYFLGPGATLYSVAIAPSKLSLTIGTPQALFHPPIFPFPWNRGSFDVATDGSRFLVNTIETAGPSQLEIATNWHRE